MRIRYFILFVSLVFCQQVRSQNREANQSAMVRLENPITVSYLKSNLRKSSPRLVLTPSIEKTLKRKIKSDPLVKNYYDAMKLNAEKILEEPLLTRHIIGRRLLATSREMLYRMNILSMVYRLGKDPEILKRINKELLAICNFADWHPSHFLDVAELSLAVAIAIDWTGDDLPAATVFLAKKSLIEKGINPSWNKDKSPSWATAPHNWNQVCNGGMIAAAIVTADVNPALAAKTISRALEGLPYALKQYGPDGVYPEGATYWGYGTSFSVITSSMLRSAFGSDFGIAAYPAFLKSADFRLLSVAPSGWYFNFSDCGDKPGEDGDITLAWFAKETGNDIYLEKDKFLRPPGSMDKLPRLAGAGLVWLSEFQQKENSSLPTVWKGDGPNPVFFFRSEPTNNHNFYFAAKGGRGANNHGNLDAGTFVFELDGVRWVVDPGTQEYNELEQAGFDLWGMCQTCQRWTLLTKSNFGHSTLTVDSALFKVNGFVPIVDFKSSGTPEATLDMTALYGNLVSSAKRKFLQENDHSVLIEDDVVMNDSTNLLTWAMMTTADVIPVKNGALLKQDGKELKLEILSPANVEVSTIMMDPPPLKLDKKIPHLKRIEVRVPAYLFPEKSAAIKVRLSAPE